MNSTDLEAPEDVWALLRESKAYTSANIFITDDSLRRHVSARFGCDGSGSLICPYVRGCEKTLVSV